MGNQPSEEVFNNDYVMIVILQKLNLKHQYLLTKVCKRLRFLIISTIWKSHCQWIQMHDIHTGSLSEEEFFKFLHLNADNIVKLHINEKDDMDFDQYFPKRYDKLLELHIVGYALQQNDFLNIIDKCPRLQIFRYDKLRGTSVFLNMKTCRNDLRLLASKVPLQHLELYDVPIWRSATIMHLENIKVLKIHMRLGNACAQSIKFIESCINLRELDITPTHLLDYNFCNTLKHLEKLRLARCISLQTVWHLLQQQNFKTLEFDGALSHAIASKPTDNAIQIGQNIETFKIEQGIFQDFPQIYKTNLWLNIFRSPRTSFANLQELCIKSQQTNDEFMQMVSAKCEQLKILNLDFPNISGRYINKLKTLHTLAIHDNGIVMPANNFCIILQDLKLLRTLEIYQQQFSWNELNMPPIDNYHVQQMRINAKGEQLPFWEHFLKNCRTNVPTFRIEEASLHKTLFQNLFTEISCLHTLQLRRCKLAPTTNIIELYIPYIKQLDFVECNIDIKWSELLEILKIAQTESVTIWNTPIYASHLQCVLETDLDGLKHLGSVTIPYELFRKKLSFWQWCFEKKCNFTLCCFDHTDNRNVLIDLFHNEIVANAVNSIHVNEELKSTKEFCAQIENAAAISVCWLDYEKLKIQKQFFEYDKKIIVITK